MPTVTLPDGKTLDLEEGTTVGQVAARIGDRLAKAALGGQINGQILELNQPIPSSECELRIVTAGDESPESLYLLRHSCAHVMAEAICDLFPETKLVYGPPVEDGFYYDIDLDRPITPEDFPAIEARMTEIVKEGRPFTRYALGREEAMGKLRDEGNRYKIGNAERAEGDELTFYVTGDRTSEQFEDLCQGPHLPDTSRIQAFKLMSVAGAYYHGDVTEKMLQRVYGTAWPTPKALRAYLNRLEEAKKRDHRKLGNELDLFVIDEEVGIGLPLWLPNGMAIREELEALGKETERRAGYQRVATPHITKAGLYETSGHLAHYKDSMFPPMMVDDEAYYLKPMNCPHHHMIYRARPRSYRDLPLRLAEYGTCYRYEQHGELAGLLRVRCMAMNDAHIYCTLDQLKEEFKAVMAMHKYYYELLGLSGYYMRLSLHDPTKTDKYVSDPEVWALAERMVGEAMDETGMAYKTEVGEAAFYGPKIDVQFKNVVGREETASTNQVDFLSAKRFDLTYVGSDNEKHHPVILHRAPLGTHERFVAFLIEHFGGAFPLWLAPVQMAVVTVSEKADAYARQVYQRLLDEGFRPQLDDSADKINAKIRRAATQKVPYILVVGEQEAAANAVNVRRRGGDRLGSMALDAFVAERKEDVVSRAKTPD